MTEEIGRLETLLNGYRGTALIYLAAKLGLSDLLAGEYRSSAELAKTLGAHPSSLHRVLRGLVALGICVEGQDGRFGLTSLGSLLQKGAPGSLRSFAVLCGEEAVGAWGGLLHSVMTGEHAFPHVFGMSQWEHRMQNPELDAFFNEWLGEATSGVTDAVLAAYDFSAFHVIADVGGGRGALLAAILGACPSASGILFEQPHVISQARSFLEAAGVASRCRTVGGSFFELAPEDADAYILKSVIHDWDDEQALTILRNCHRASKRQGKLLLIERLLPERVEQEPEVIMKDLHMMAITGGRERSKTEFRRLLEAAGFSMIQIVPTSSGFCIIEALQS